MQLSHFVFFPPSSSIVYVQPSRVCEVYALPRLRVQLCQCDFYAMSCPGNASATCFRVLCKCRMPRGFLHFHELKTEFSARLTGDPFLQMKENKFSGFLTSLGIFFKQIYNNIKHSYTRHITRHQSSKAHDSIQIILTLRQLSSYLRKLRFNLCHVTFATKVH